MASDTVSTRSWVNADHEQRGRPEADTTEEQDGSESTLRERQKPGSNHRGGNDCELQRGVCEHAIGGKSDITEDREQRQRDDREQNDGQVDRQRTRLDHRDEAACPAQDLAEASLEDVGCVGTASQLGLHRFDRPPDHKQRSTAGEGDDRQDEGGLEAGPENELVDLGLLVECRSSGAHDAGCPSVGDTENDGRYHQECSRCHQGCAGLVDGGLDSFDVGERSPQETQGVCAGDRGCTDKDSGGESDAGDLGIEQTDDGSLLGQEAGEPGDSRHRGTADHRRDDHEWHGSAQPAQFGDLSGVSAVIDDPDDHEQAGLEHGVRGEQRRAGEQQLRCARAEHGDEHAELADGAVREQQLEVGLAKGPVAAPDHRGQADDQGHRFPRRKLVQVGREAGDEEDTGLHHRGRVQICRHGGRGGHCTRQPAVEGNLRRLGETPDQDEHGGPRREGTSDRCLGEAGKGAGAGTDREHDQPGKEHQPAGGGDDQCLLGRTTSSGLGVLESDEAVRRDRGEFPEHEDENEAVRAHETCHRSGEDRQQSGKATESVFVVEVLTGVGHDQHADAADDAQHQQGELIDDKAQIEAEAGHPGLVLDDRGSVVDVRRLQRDPRKRGRRGEHRDPENSRPKAWSERSSKDPDRDMDDENRDHRSGRVGRDMRSANRVEQASDPTGVAIAQTVSGR